MLRWCLVAAILAAPLVAAPAAANDGTAFCSWGGGQLLLERIRPGNEEALYERCRVGDTIAIPLNFAVTVGRICDFSQQIVVQTRTVVCVIRPLRTTRPTD
jgi:hypothetical protein